MILQRSQSSRFYLLLILVLTIFIIYDLWLPLAERPSKTLVDKVLPPYVNPGDAAVGSPAPTSSNVPQYTSPPPSTDLGVSTITDGPLPHCQQWPGAPDIMLTLKTGGTEIYQKLPEHLATILTCAKDPLIVSDLEQTVGPFTTFDACRSTTFESQSDAAEFQLYRDMRNLAVDGQDISELKSQIGWDLDKWKFFPMINEAYDRRKDAKWYVFMEADTYLSWHNLRLLLQRLDPEQPYYFGAQILINIAFAHGGSGIVISRGAMRKIQDERAQDPVAYQRKWEPIYRYNWAGDETLSRQFLDVAVNVTPAFPLLQGETPSTLDYSSKHWCVPALSWHHMRAFEIEQLWHFEQQWVLLNGLHNPYLYRDVFAAFVRPKLRPLRHAWDALSTDWIYTAPDHIPFYDRAPIPTPPEYEHMRPRSTEPFAPHAPDEDTPSEDADAHERKWDALAPEEQASVASFENCAALCDRVASCVQWTWRPGRCGLGREVRLGRWNATVLERVGGRAGTHVLPDTEKEQADPQQQPWGCVSGWMLHRVDAFVRAQGDCMFDEQGRVSDEGAIGAVVKELGRWEWDYEQPRPVGRV